MLFVNEGKRINCLGMLISLYNNTNVFCKNTVCKVLKNINSVSRDICLIPLIDNVSKITTDKILVITQY